jgi:hypothetical protein
MDFVKGFYADMECLVAMWFAKAEGETHKVSQVLLSSAAFHLLSIQPPPIISYMIGLCCNGLGNSSHHGGYRRIRFFS